ITVLDAKKAPKYSDCPSVPDFGAIYGVKETTESMQGMSVYLYDGAEVKKAVKDEKEIDNYGVILEKNGFEDFTWAIALAGGELGEELTEDVDILGFYMKGTYMLVFAKEKTTGAYFISTMDISTLE
ncbi:MAG: hypothetical protein MJ177_01820, partial [Clostridia bacterium]|nr:hypothetical protein [Clostridia bacterium]